MAIFATGGAQQLAATISLPRPWTWSCWSRHDDANTFNWRPTFNMVKTNGDGGPGSGVFKEGQATFVVANRLNNDTNNGTSYPHLDPAAFTTWYFHSLSYTAIGDIEGGITSVPLSGWEISTQTNNNGATNPMGYLTIGKYAGSSAETMYGALEEVRIWSRALSLDEQLQEARYGAGPLSRVGLYAHYPLLDNSNYLLDYSGNGHDLTVVTGGFGFCAGAITRDPIIRWRAA